MTKYINFLIIKLIFCIYENNIHSIQIINYEIRHYIWFCNQMITQNQISIDQVLSPLNNPNFDLQSLNNYLINYFAHIIPMKSQAEVNRLNQLLHIIHLNVHHRKITPEQRRSILQKLLFQRYLDISLFENALSILLQQCLNVAKSTLVQTYQNKQDPNEKYIRQLKQEDQIEKRRQQQATHQLIQKMKKEQDQFFKHQMKKPLDDDINMQCPICQQSIKANHLALLDCEHAFHKNCTFRHFSQCIQDRNFPLKCPQCSEQVIFPDIQAYLTYQYKKKFQKYTLQKYLNVNQADLSWCPTPGCQFVFVYDEGMTKFRCSSCLKKYCLKCKNIYHPNSTCKSRVNDEKFLKFAKGNKLKECAKCRRWVQKKSGCDHITCVCGYHFCYKCGGKYSNCQCKNKVGVRNQQLGGGLWDMIVGNKSKNNQDQDRRQNNNAFLPNNELGSHKKTPEGNLHSNTPQNRHFK